MRWVLAAIGALGLLPTACLRAPLTDEIIGEGGTADDGEDDDGDPITDDDGSSGTDADPSCHPSYEPCLPVVDDLNCPDVVALELAPVVVIGPDEYMLDADNDGTGCE